MIKAITPEGKFLVKFDVDELGLWHDDDGDPVLILGDKDLVRTN